MRTSRQHWVIGNWKMNGSVAENVALLTELKQGLPERGVHVAVCAPYPYLYQLQQLQVNSARPIFVGAQDVSDQAVGAYTGQISARMLAEFNVSLVLVGHSERRQYNCENNDLIAHKAAAAVAQGLIPVICIGENLEQREAGEAERVVAEQLAPCMDIIVAAEGKILLAYEPVWAIGTGKTASPAQAQKMHAFIRSKLHAKVSTAAETSVLYGGSVKAANAAELFSQPDIDGGLIGGASLSAQEFLAIAHASIK